MLTGGGTDPNSGPLLALLALAFWPLAAPPELASRQPGSVATSPVGTGLKEPDDGRTALARLHVRRRDAGHRGLLPGPPGDLLAAAPADRPPGRRAPRADGRGHGRDAGAAAAGVLGRRLGGHLRRATLWFGWLAVREYRRRAALGRFRPHHAQHVLGCAAMVYMFAAVDHGREGRVRSGMGGMGGGARFPTLALVFALALFGYVVWTAAPGPALPRSRAGFAQPAPAPAGPAALTGPGHAAASSLARRARRRRSRRGGDAARLRPRSPRQPRPGRGPVRWSSPPGWPSLPDRDGCHDGLRADHDVWPVARC